jgi:general secretion pathway protein F
MPTVETLSLDHLVALNDEIAALVRGGLPLERGLRLAGGELPGRLRGTMTGLADRMSRGASLPEALQAERERLPRIYRAVVEAGLRSGRLSSALEGLAGFVRTYIDSRRVIGLALCYPLLVLTLAGGLFLLMVGLVVPRLLAAFDSFRVPAPAALRWLGWLGERLIYWGPVLPVLLVVVLAAWAWSGRGAAFGGGRGRGRAGSLLRLVPWMSGLLRHYEAANFADLLGLLVEQGVPYPEALALAADATGDAAVVRLAGALGEAIEGGDPPGEVLRRLPARARALPPLLCWLLATGRQQGALAESLHALAAYYRRRAQHQAEKLRVFLPIVGLLAIGLTAALLLTLSLFVPLTTLLRDLAIPVN